MCSIQNWKVKLAYAGFGCLFGSICTIMGMLASPVTAQKDKLGDIECTNLTVVDGGGIYLKQEDGPLGVLLGGFEYGKVTVFDSEGNPRVWLSGRALEEPVAVIQN